jgi:hypothetical protein
LLLQAQQDRYYDEEATEEEQVDGDQGLESENEEFQRDSETQRVSNRTKSTSRGKENTGPRPFSSSHSGKGVLVTHHRRQQRAQDHRISTEMARNTLNSQGKLPTRPAGKPKKPNPDADSSDEENKTPGGHKADLLAELQRLQGELAKKDLELKTVKAKKSSASTTRIPMNKDWDKKFKELTKEFLWRTCKFLNNDDQLHLAVMEIMDQIPEIKAKYLDLTDKSEIDANVKGFVETYGGAVTSTLNTYRSDCQAGVRNAYIERALAKKPLPTPKQMLNIILRRDIDPDQNPENWDLFLWYWKDILPKVVGGKRWGYAQRNYGCIIDHTFPDDKTKRYITSKDEAMVVLFFENCGQRFPYAAECALAGVDEDKECDRYQSAYSDGNTGQNKWGGWFLEGRARFKDLLKAIMKEKRSRKAEIKELELKALEFYQTKFGIKGRQKKGKRKRIIHAFEDAEEAIVGFGQESDAESVSSVKSVEEFVGKYMKARPKRTKK